MADELLTPGKGKFKVKRAKLHDDDGRKLLTKNGDRKAMLVIEVIDAKGNKGVVFEHLTMKAAWKVEIICKACRLHELFISDALCLDKLDELEGAVGECIVGHSEPDPQWPVKNIITKYIAPKANESKLAKIDASEAPFFEDDEIPF